MNLNKKIFNIKFFNFLLIFLISFSIFNIDINQAQAASSWQVVGSENFLADAGPSTYRALAFDSSDTLYIAMLDWGGSYYGATVMKYDGSSWSIVGSREFSTGGVDYVSIAFDSSDTPYVAFQDDDQSNKTTVMKYDGSSWVVVGSAGFSAGLAQDITLSIDSTDTPYVAYTDNVNSNKATVMKYDGSSWVVVGSAGFSAGWSQGIDLDINSSDELYVIYSDGGNSYRATVMKYDGSSWSTVGSAGFSGTADVYSTTIAIDSSDTPYSCFSDGDNSYYMTCMEYDGSSWSTIGSAGFSGVEVDYASIKIDSSDNIYTAYSDASNIYDANVMKYNGSSWERVGTANFSTDEADYQSLAFDSSDTPYIGFLGWSGPIVMSFSASSSSSSSTYKSKYSFVTNSNTTINNGEATTDNNEVELLLEGSSIQDYIISENKDFNGAKWEKFECDLYAPVKLGENGLFINPMTLKYSLSDTEGEKNIYIKYRSSAKNVTNVIEDSIIYKKDVDNDNDNESDEEDFNSNKPLEDKTFVRTLDNPTIYFIDGEHKKPVPNEQIFFTYNNNWDSVKWINKEDLNEYKLGDYLLPKPNTVLIKITSNKKTYLITETEGGLPAIRWISSEKVAESIYGGDWKDYVIDIPPTMFVNFKKLSPLRAFENIDISQMKKREELKEI